jgi:glycine cleavage system transcriptional repressor
MQNFLTLAAVGTNRPNLVEALCKAIRDAGCSIQDSRMATLGSEMSFMGLLAGTWDAIAKLENSLPRLEESLGLSVIAKRTTPAAKQGDKIPYAVEVISADRVGIAYEMVHFFTQREIHIEDMYSSSYAAMHTGTRMFSLHLTISIPTDLSIAGLRGEFMDFCDHLNLDSIMEPVK